MNAHAAVESFLKRYGSLLAAGDTSAIARCWEMPALAISDDRAMALSEEKHVRDFVGQGWEKYRQQELVTMKPIYFCVTELSPRLMDVDVTWAAADADADAHVKAHESAHYILRMDEGGAPRIRVAISRPNSS
jgi:hypothetical protein